MATALELRAAEAWRLLSRPRSLLGTIAGQEPMPPGVALDYVQEETGGDRDDAVMAILHAAARTLENSMPQFGNADAIGYRDIATGIVGDVRGETLGLAAIHARHLASSAEAMAIEVMRGAYRDVPGSPSELECDDWRRWAVAAQKAIKSCEAVVAAAYPAESS